MCTQIYYMYINIHIYIIIVFVYVCIYMISRTGLLSYCKDSIPITEAAVMLQSLVHPSLQKPKSSSQGPLALVLLHTSEVFPLGCEASV